MSPTRHEAAAYRSAAPGTLDSLHEAIKIRMAEVATTFWGLETKTSEHAPIVVDGWLPPLSSAGDERFSFLIVRPKTGTDSEQGANQDARATFEIVVGTYSDTDDGWRDVVHLIDAIRESLAAAPSLASTSFEHTGPLTWELLEEQPRPQWLGRVTTNWTLPRARRVGPQEG
jgi:hypothetical protein